MDRAEFQQLIAELKKRQNQPRTTLRKNRPRPILRNETSPRPILRNEPSPDPYVPDEYTFDLPENFVIEDPPPKNPPSLFEQIRSAVPGAIEGIAQLGRVVPGSVVGAAQLSQDIRTGRFYDQVEKSGPGALFDYFKDARDVTKSMASDAYGFANLTYASVEPWAPYLPGASEARRYTEERYSKANREGRIVDEILGDVGIGSFFFGGAGSALGRVPKRVPRPVTPTISQAANASTRAANTLKPATTAFETPPTVRPRGGVKGTGGPGSQMIAVESKGSGLARLVYNQAQKRGQNPNSRVKPSTVQRAEQIAHEMEYMGRNLDRLSYKVDWLSPEVALWRHGLSGARAAANKTGLLNKMTPHLSKLARMSLLAEAEAEVKANSGASNADKRTPVWARVVNYLAVSTARRDLQGAWDAADGVLERQFQTIIQKINETGLTNDQTWFVVAKAADSTTRPDMIADLANRSDLPEGTAQQALDQWNKERNNLKSKYEPITIEQIEFYRQYRDGELDQNVIQNIDEVVQLIRDVADSRTQRLIESDRRFDKDNVARAEWDPETETVKYGQVPKTLKEKLEIVDERLEQRDAEIDGLLKELEVAKEQYDLLKLFDEQEILTRADIESRYEKKSNMEETVLKLEGQISEYEVEIAQLEAERKKSQVAINDTSKLQNVKQTFSEKQAAVDNLTNQIIKAEAALNTAKDNKQRLLGDLSDSNTAEGLVVAAVGELRQTALDIALEAHKPFAEHGTPQAPSSSIANRGQLLFWEQSSHHGARPLNEWANDVRASHPEFAQFDDLMLWQRYRATKRGLEELSDSSVSNARLIKAIADQLDVDVKLIDSLHKGDIAGSAAKSVISYLNKVAKELKPEIRESIRETFKAETIENLRDQVATLNPKEFRQLTNIVADEVNNFLRNQEHLPALQEAITTRFENIDKKAFVNWLFKESDLLPEVNDPKFSVLDETQMTNLRKVARDARNLQTKVSQEGVIGGYDTAINNFDSLLEHVSKNRTNTIDQKLRDVNAQADQTTLRLKDAASESADSLPSDETRKTIDTEFNEAQRAEDQPTTREQIQKEAAERQKAFSRVQELNRKLEQETFFKNKDIRKRQRLENTVPQTRLEEVEAQTNRLTNELTEEIDLLFAGGRAGTLAEVKLEDGNKPNIGGKIARIAYHANVYQRVINKLERTGYFNDPKLVGNENYELSKADQADVAEAVLEAIEEQHGSIDNAIKTTDLTLGQVRQFRETALVNDLALQLELPTISPALNKLGLTDKRISSYQWSRNQLLYRLDELYPPPGSKQIETRPSRLQQEIGKLVGEDAKTKLTDVLKDHSRQRQNLFERFNDDISAMMPPHYRRIVIQGRKQINELQQMQLNAIENYGKAVSDTERKAQIGLIEHIDDAVFDAHTTVLQIIEAGTNGTHVIGGPGVATKHSNAKSKPKDIGKGESELRSDNQMRTGEVETNLASYLKLEENQALRLIHDELLRDLVNDPATSLSIEEVLSPEQYADFKEKTLTKNDVREIAEDNGYRLIVNFEKPGFEDYPNNRIDEPGYRIAKKLDEQELAIVEESEIRFVPAALADGADEMLNPYLGGRNRLVEKAGIVWDDLAGMWKLTVLPLRLKWFLGNLWGNHMMAIGAGIGPIKQVKELAKTLHWEQDVLNAMETKTFETPDDVPKLNAPFASVKTGVPASTDPRLTSGNFTGRQLKETQLDDPELITGRALANMSNPDYRRNKIDEKNKDGNGSSVAAAAREATMALPNLVDTGYRINQNVDEFARLMVFNAQLEGKLPSVDPAHIEPGTNKIKKEYEDKYASDYDKAAETSTRFALGAMGDFSRLTKFERTVLKRVFPFYPWLRHQISISLRLPVNNPLRDAFLTTTYDHAKEDKNGPIWNKYFLDTAAVGPIDPNAVGADKNYPRFGRLDPGSALPYKPWDQLPGNVFQNQEIQGAINPVAVLLTELLTNFDISQGAISSRPRDQYQETDLGQTRPPSPLQRLAPALQGDLSGVLPAVGELGYRVSRLTPQLAAVTDLARSRLDDDFDYTSFTYDSGDVGKYENYEGGTFAKFLNDLGIPVPIRQPERERTIKKADEDKRKGK